MKKRSILITCAILVVLIALCVVLAVVHHDGGTEKTIFVTVTAPEFQKELTVETREDYLGPALTAEKIVSGEVTQYGLFIEAALDRRADEGAEEWWCITKAGESVTVGADEVPIADGDRFELTLKTGY